MQNILIVDRRSETRRRSEGKRDKGSQWQEEYVSRPQGWLRLSRIAEILLQLIRVVHW